MVERAYWVAWQLSRWVSQLVEQNLVLRSHELRHASHCRLHSVQPMFDGQPPQYGQLNRQSVSARLQPSRQRLASPVQSRRGGAAGGGAGAASERRVARVGALARV